MTDSGVFGRPQAAERNRQEKAARIFHRDTPFDLYKTFFLKNHATVIQKITAAQFGKPCDRILQEAGDPLKCLRFARRYRLGFSGSDADNDHRSVFAVV